MDKAGYSKSDLRKNKRLCCCQTCGGDCFYIDKKWWHEDIELDAEHTAEPNQKVVANA